MRGRFAEFRSPLAGLVPALFSVLPGVAFKGDGGGDGADDDDPPKGGKGGKGGDDDDAAGKGKGGKGGKGGKDGEDDDSKDDDDDDEGDDGKGGKGGKGGDEDDDDSKPTITKKEHESALARARAQSARRFRRVESELKELRKTIDPDGGDDDSDDADEGKGSKRGEGSRDKPDGKGALKRQLEKEKAERIRISGELRMERTEKSIRAAAKEHGLYAEDVVDILRGRLSFESEAADSEAFVRVKKDGDTVDLTIDEYVADLGKLRPHLKRGNKRPAGSGSRGSRGGGSGGGDGTPAKPKTFAEAEAAAAQRLRDASRG